MKIIVCIKQVLDTGAKIEMQGEKVVASGSPFIMNPYDEFALEEAIRIKSALPDSDITVFFIRTRERERNAEKGLSHGR